MYLSTLLQLFCGAQFYWWRKQLAPYTTITNCHVKLYRVHPITGRNRITITNCHVKLYRVHPITGRNRIHNFSGDRHRLHVNNVRENRKYNKEWKIWRHSQHWPQDKERRQVKHKNDMEK
jgi:hypothetical protein